MNARELLHRLEGLGVDLEVAEGRLRVSASRGRLDDGLKADIAAHKAELMALLAERGAVAHTGQAPRADEAPRARVAHDGLLPLSLFQERLWILQQLEPESTTYLLALAWPVRGEVPREQLLAAVQRVHARHLGLRVHFVQEDGVPGARRVEVLWQFLLEAVFLTSAGGLLGIACGASIGYLVHWITGFPISLPWWAFAIGIGFSAGVGVFFGMIPAVRASKLDPIEALRYE